MNFDGTLSWTLNLGYFLNDHISSFVTRNIINISLRAVFHPVTNDNKKFVNYNNKA